METAEWVRELLELHRARNGRLAPDMLSRRLQARWRLLFLDGQYYDRARLRRLVERVGRARAVVPDSRRRFGPSDWEALDDPSPWRVRERRG